jgi:hypothetical protein
MLKLYYLFNKCQYISTHYLQLMYTYRSENFYVENQL